jgi:hypothetical protein
MATNGGVPLVHRVVAGDQSDNPAGAHNVKKFNQLAAFLEIN